MLGDLHAVVELLGSSVTLDRFEQSSQSVIITDSAFGVHEELQAAAERYLKVTHQATGITVSRLEKLADAVHDAAAGLAKAEQTGREGYQTIERKVRG
jgi:hypothetical protein